jgi:anti-anti-sigma regulatory factor
MLRLTVRSQSPEEVVLALDGRLADAEVAVLAEEGEGYLQESRRLVLDLTGVQFIDRSGLELLERWSGEQLVLRGGTWFIRLLLERHGLATQTAGDDSPSA